MMKEPEPEERHTKWKDYLMTEFIYPGANFELVKTKLGYLHLPGFPINKRKELSVDTKGQHSNAVYCLIRKWRVTATTMKTFHSMTIPIPSKRRKTVFKTLKKKVRDMMNVKQFSDNRTPAAMKWGRDHKNAARDSFENLHGLKVKQTGNIFMKTICG